MVGFDKRCQHEWGRYLRYPHRYQTYSVLKVTRSLSNRKPYIVALAWLSQ